MALHALPKLLRQRRVLRGGIVAEGSLRKLKNAYIGENRISKQLDFQAKIQLAEGILLTSVLDRFTHVPARAAVDAIVFFAGTGDTWGSKKTGVHCNPV